MSATTSRRIAGATQILIDGVAFPVTEASWSPSNVVRETLKGLDGVHGYSELPQQGAIHATLRDQGNYGVGSFNSKTSSDVQVQVASGKSIGGAGMWCTEAIMVSAAEGTYEVVFEGLAVTEILAS